MRRGCVHDEPEYARRAFALLDSACRQMVDEPPANLRALRDAAAAAMGSDDG